MSVSSVIRQGLGSTTSDLVRLGLGSGAPPPAAIGPIITLGLKYTPSDIIGLGLGASVATTPTITSVTAVSGTELSVAWTGTATQYRLNGGTATALPDGTSPDTISGLTDNTYYLVELRDGAGAWSTGVSEWTDNTGSGGGEEAHDTVSAVLAGAGAVTAGSAARTRVHAATGALAGAGASVAGAAARSRVHTSSGVLSGAGAAVAGSADIALPAGTHSAAGAQAGAGAAVVSTATVLRIHAATGVLVAAGAEVVGAASIRLIHEATGVLAGAGAQIVALAARPSANSAAPSGHGPALARRGRNLNARTR